MPSAAKLEPLPHRKPWSNNTQGQLEILGASENLLRARWRNLYVMRWYGECTVAELRIVFAEVKKTADIHGTVAAVSLLDAGCKPPDTSARETAARNQAEMGERLTGTATLVDGQGFWASVILNALLGIQLAKPNRGKNERVFRRLSEASSWLAQFTIGRPSAEAVENVISQCRAEEHPQAQAF